ncbi:MAG: CoA transferase, partial [Bacteroidaceae bacterium]|nr:CoA transferase [Bacteroidaceae bacterium]
MDLGKWAFNNRLLVYFLVGVLLVGGIYSCYEMSKLEDPEVKVKMAMVITTYPGASAHQVEMEVTDVLEKKGVLTGLRVLDFGQYIAGPLTAMMLGDYGADVIHVDPPGGPRWDGWNANAVLGRGKRNI